MSELLFEIGSEELPAAYAREALSAMPGIVARELTARGLAVEAARVRVAGTPRRLAAGVDRLPPSTPRATRTVLGPPKSAAYKDGRPTKAAEGFAAKSGLPVDRLTVVATEKGEYLAAQVEEGGRPTSEVLAEALPAVIGSIPFPKSMRWASLEARFARPVRWILAAFDGRRVPFSWGGLESGTVTHGHRFLAPGPVEVTRWSDYERALEAAHVVVDPTRRRERVFAESVKAAASVGGTLDADGPLLDTVNFLVEEPHPVVGGFDPALLDLPADVIVTPMRVHQRYFPVRDANGALMAHFVTVANVPARDPAVVARGNERVLRARLADARYFFELDLKTPLEAMAAGLDRVTFQQKLGSYAEKVERTRALALEIHAALAGTPGLPEAAAVDRAARLAKADLTSKMVFEFPELQGLMGRTYARRAGEHPNVAEAIAEHHQPRFAGDALPASHLGAILSIADRLDTVAGIFGIGERPTGSADPFGLRRHALAVIGILRHREYRLPLRRLLASAARGFAGKVKEPERAAVEAADYVKGRLENALREEGLPYDAVDAALSARFDDVNEAVARAKAVAELKGLPEVEPIAVGFKRAANLLGTARKEDLGGPVDPSAFVHDAERALHRAAVDVAESVRGHARAGRWPNALGETVRLKGPIDAFYGSVMVMDQDERIRRNRLALLSEVVGIFAGIADVTKIVSSNDRRSP